MTMMLFTIAHDDDGSDHSDGCNSNTSNNDDNGVDDDDDVDPVWQVHLCIAAQMQ